jgi:hypothetical protein
MNDTKVYKLGICGNPKLSGVGMMGNVVILIYLIHKYNCNIYFDTYSNGKCIMYDEDYEADFNIKNPFEYYFEPLIDVNNISEELIDKQPTFFPELKYGFYDLKFKPLYDSLKQKFFKQYKIKEDILNEVTEFEKKNFANDIILGVQIRTTDLMASGMNHDVEYFFKRMEIVSKIHDNISKIFIATDNHEIIKLCREKFNNKTILCLENIDRAHSINDTRGNNNRINNESVMHIYDDRKYHNYLCGKEPLIDTLLLSKCDYLIKSRSALSDLAVLFSEKIKKIY